MRIITGRARGLKLLEPKNYDVRPTADRVKESLFNIIARQLPGSRVLDLFAGTGNLGLEAWSRGAAAITFVDLSPSSLKLVRGNIAKCRAEADCTVWKGQAVKMMSRLAAAGPAFDFLFCDPPYNKGWVQKVLQEPALAKLLSQKGLIIAEHSAHDSIETALLPGWQLKRRERYGETCLSFIARDPS